MLCVRDVTPAHFSSKGRIAGNSKTSLMLMLSVSSMVKRSMPMPHPPVGGRPYSSDTQNVSSMAWLSSSPFSLSFAWSAKHSRCRLGSFSSVYALHTSRPFTNSSNRSVRPGKPRCHLASGDMTCGWSQIKLGLMQSGSMKSPTSLSSRRAVVVGGGHATLLSAHSLTRKAFVSSEYRSLGIVTPSFFSSVAIMGKRGHGGVKSTSMGSASGPLAWY
mmetsp:Transcript_40857/g.102874  ORF Transcript_40857/g.102874 Transcript_40857/m.102874 type:complete len:217 (-) Transcript_40857:1134-1784(-)